MNIELLTPAWDDYELIDCGGFEKLERFGRYVTARPEPQAVWDKSLSEAEWQQRADAWFRRDPRGDRSGERGQWTLRPGMPEQWSVGYDGEGMKLRMRLGLTSFKHVGVFPEQASNWDFIAAQVRRIAARKKGAAGGVDAGSESARDGGGRAAEAAGVQVLNLFAYTGGATLAACSAGASVTHVDSVKPVVSWARENMEASGLDGVRWMVDDALKFARREVKRGRKYNGIILDPPAYGRGPDGEKWILEEHINELLRLCGELLEADGSFLVLNLYSMGFSALLARTAVRQLVGGGSGEQMGELCFDDSFGKTLPLGVYYRLWRE